MEKGFADQAKMTSALSNLMANYADSEGEEPSEGGSEGEEEGVASLADMPTRLEAPTKAPGTPYSSSAFASSNKSAPIKKAALVSYQDLSDEDQSPVPMDLEVDGDGNEREAEAEQKRLHNTEEFWEWQDVVKLPSEPSGHCSKELQEKIEVAWKNKEDQNRRIQGKKTFRNPSLYENLIIECNIDELGTNFPPHLNDAYLFGAESFYEELSKDTAWGTETEKALEQRLGYSPGSWDTDMEKDQEQRLSERDRIETVGTWDIEGMTRLGQ